MSISELASTSVRIRAYYRRHDDFLRYTAADKDRMADLGRLYTKAKRYFGRDVLDLACGGGALGFVVESKGHSYVGIDINPDAVGAARNHAAEVGSRNRFVLEDIRSVKLEGTFDTLTLLGNALCHFNTSEFVSIMANVERNIHMGSYFIVDYRDVVSLLFAGKWSRKRYVQKRGGTTVTSLTRRIDTERGDAVIDSLAKGRRPLRFTYAIWSPFIIEPLMRLNKWKLVRREFRRLNSSWLDIYRRL